MGYNSPKTQLASTGLSPRSYSTVRWWSRYEVIKQVHDAFGDVSSFLNGNTLLPPSSRRLNDILSDPVKCICFVYVFA